MKISLWRHTIKNSIVLLCLLILSHINTFGQEDTEQVLKNTVTKKPKSVYTLPHSIGISQRFGGSRVWTTGLNYYQAASLTSVDFYIQKRKGMSQYTPLIQLRLAGPLGSAHSIFPLGGATSFPPTNVPTVDYTPYFGAFVRTFNIGFLLGGSQYIFDMRSKVLGTGWSLLVNGGFTINFYKSPSDYYESDTCIFSIPVSIGGEVSFKPVYNFSRRLAITFGFDMGFEMFYNGRFDLKGSSTITYGPALQYSLNYGFSVGLLF